MSLTAFLDTAAALITLAALFGYLNHRWLRLPPTIGLVVIALAASVAALLVDAIVPAVGIGAAVRGALDQVDFPDVLMKGMLSFLLFAGALHVDLGALLRRRWAIGLMATFGTLLSTFVVGFAVFFTLPLFGLSLPLPYALVFGALISPTDPVAVLGILKKVAVPPSLEAKIAGESLFNDGVGIVVFTILVAIASGTGAHGEAHVAITPVRVVLLFLQEAIGGAVLGFIGGFIAYRAMRAIDDYTLEVLITLSLVMATYAIAARLGASGPIAVVVAGLFIGNHATRYAMSETTRDHLEKFWHLLDEVLNAVLFLIIGLEVVAFTFTAPIFAVIAVTIVITLAARFLAVAAPIAVLSLRRDFTTGAVPMLTWGGLRGGISVALALSLPAFAGKDTVLAMTYGVVVFSIVVQGLTLERVAARVIGREPS